MREDRECTSQGPGPGIHIRPGVIRLLGVLFGAALVAAVALNAPDMARYVKSEMM